MSENLNPDSNKQQENPGVQPPVSSDQPSWLGSGAVGPNSRLSPLAQSGLPKKAQDMPKVGAEPLILNSQQTPSQGKSEDPNKLNTQAEGFKQTRGFSSKMDNSLSWGSNLWGATTRSKTKSSQVPASKSGLGKSGLEISTADMGPRSWSPGDAGAAESLKSENQDLSSSSAAASLKAGLKNGAGASTLGRNKLKTPDSGLRSLNQRPLSSSRRSVGPQVTYEEIGLFPRSFSRVFDRFFKQIFSDVENLVIQEYRFYRYLFLTTIKTLCILFFVPFAVNFIAKTYLIRPITEYFWNTQQTEIFLNSYEQKRAFAELEEFEEKLYFESLLASKNAIVSSPFLKSSWAPSTAGGSSSQLTRYSNGSESRPSVTQASQDGPYGPQNVEGVTSSWSPSGPGTYVEARNPLIRTELNKQEQHGLDPKLNYLNKGFNTPSTIGSQPVTNSNVLINSNLVGADSKEAGGAQDKNLKQELPKANGIKLDNQFERSNPSTLTPEIQQAPTLPETLGSLQEKILELAIRYNNHSIEAITNFFADFVSLMTLLYLLVSLEIQINITKSFLLEVFFGLDDSKKSLLILIMTDLLVGYHSSNLWELFFQFIFNHYGIPESQTGIFLLVATLPVLLDVLFKYLIFRHLNRSSPATVATYHAIIE